MSHYSDLPCSCGCGQPLGKINRKTYYALKNGKTSGWKKGHRFRGRNNPNWKGRVSDDGQGYLMIWRPDHPNARKGGWILEHRYVISQHLGRPLQTHEVVHHINGDKRDNRIDNLEITDASVHAKHHQPRRPRPTHCKRGHEFTPENTRIDSRGGQVCRTCKRLWWRNKNGCTKPRKS